MWRAKIAHVEDAGVNLIRAKHFRASILANHCGFGAAANIGGIAVSADGLPA